jgi:hypothetical protein
MGRRVASCAVVVACFYLMGASVGVAQSEKVVPVHEEPRHHLVFEAPVTRILDVQIPAGDTTLFHTHSDPILYVSMSQSQTRSQTLGGEWSGGDAAQGARAQAGAASSAPAAPAPPPRLGRMTSSTSYAKEPLTHRVNNVGQGLFRLIGILNRTAGDETDTPSEGFDAKPEITNRWFRGYRWSLTPDPKPHRHRNPVAVVLITGRASARGASTTTLEKAGQFAWFDGDAEHMVASVGGDAEVVEVEVRRPR